jgi:hypothetical protein
LAEVEIQADEMTWVGDEIKLKFHPLFGVPDGVTVTEQQPAIS